MLAALIIGTAALTAAGCGGADPSPGIDRCYETPRPPQPAYPAQAPKTLRLSQDNKGVVTGDPASIPADAQAMLDGAGVTVGLKLRDGVHYGSGFLTRNAQGRLLVVTAAHVVLDPTSTTTSGIIGNITVTDSTGTTTGVTGGCLIYESSSNGFELLATSLHYTVDKDVAVLFLRHDIGSHTLPLASAGPRRGSWYTTSNMGNKATPGHPNHYHVLAVGNPRDGTDEGTFDLSGLQPFHTPDATIDYTTHGASGGMLTTIPPEDGNVPQVVGILTGGYATRPADPGLLRREFGVESAGHLTATPQVDYLTPVNILTAAIAATDQRTGTPQRGVNA